MNKYLKYSLVAFIAIIAFFLAAYVTIKRENIVDSFRVLHGDLESISEEDRKKLVSDFKTVSEENASLKAVNEDLITNKFDLESKSENVDLILLSSYGNIHQAWSLSKPLGAVITKNMYEWIDGSIESASIKGADYNLNLTSVYEDYGKILPATTKMEVVVKSGIVKVLGDQEIIKYCVEGVCHYGTYEKYQEGKENFCASTTFTSSEVCFSSSIAFYSSKDEHIQNGTFKCTGVDKNNKCDSMVKSFVPYVVNLNEGE